MPNVITNKDGSEILLYDEPGIPIYIRSGRLSYYPDYRARCHWHEDIEFIYIVEGQMDYYINGKNVLLQSGDSLMVNSGRLHYGYSTKRQDCEFYCIILHPSLITANKKLYTKYVESVTQNLEPDYLLFPPTSEAGALLQSMYQKKTDRSPSCELEVVGLFHKLWGLIYEIVRTRHERTADDTDTCLLAQRQMVSFICQNYSGNITLNDIAAAGNVCRSKCCQIFKKYVGQSPVDFLNSYRLEYSQNLLLTTDLSITEICMACGFNHLSYFSRQFQAKFGCTPRTYRHAAESSSDR